MSLFLSTFVNKVDKKGRVSVPAPFRTLLSRSETRGFVAFRSLVNTAIEGFASEKMEDLATRVDAFQLFSEEQTDLTASIFADAHVLTFDSEGRVMLTEALRNHAEIDAEVAFVGRGPTFQMWNPKLFDTYQQQARERLKVSRPTLSPSSKAGAA